MINDGSKVTFHYVLSVEGEIVDSSAGEGPLEYVHGNGDIIEGLEEEMMGLKVGDKKSVHIKAELAYGPYQEEALAEVPISQFDRQEDFEIGEEVHVEIDDEDVPAIVIGIEGDQVKLDFNHPLAGKDLDFEIEIVSVQ